MKVLIFLPNIAGGGAERIALQLYSHLKNQDEFSSIYLVIQENIIHYDYLDKSQIIKLKNRNTFYSLLEFYKLLKKEKPNTVVSFLIGPNLINIITSKITSHRSLITVHNNTSLERSSFKGLKNRFMTFLVKLFYRQADKIVSVSKGVNDDLINNFKVNQAKTRIIYNPVAELPLNIKRISSPFNNQAPIIITIGRLNKVKQFDKLIHKFNNISKKISCNLIILGEGEERGTLVKLVEKYGLESRIYMPGFIDNIFEYLKISSLFVLCSEREGFANVILEAMKTSIPILSFNTPYGPSEILDDGKYGTLVENQNWDILEYEIENILNNSEIRKNLSNKSLERSKLFSNINSLNLYKKTILEMKY